ncbi:MAG: site-specific integrase, partial [Chloroflexota bacterium]
PYKAVERVFQHVETLPSSRTTRHTARQYRISLYDYLTFCGAGITQDQTDKTRMDGDCFDFRGMRLHTEQQMRDYISYSQVQGRSSATIKKYLAVVGHYLDGLQKKAFIGVRGDLRFAIEDMKTVFQQARDVSPPKKETRSSEGAASRRNRLSQAQAREYMRSIEQDTVIGKRDRAIFYIMTMTSLRVAEVARMTLKSIRQGATSYEIRVRGKGNDIDAVGLDMRGYTLIMDYVEAYNAGLDEGDTRRISHETALWQSMRRHDNYKKLNERWFDPKTGLKPNAIRRMIGARTPDVLREQLGGAVVKPHDLRATYAKGMQEAGANITHIQRQMRHKSPTTTSGYIGANTDLSKGLLSNYWQILDVG